MHLSKQLKKVIYFWLSIGFFLTMVYLNIDYFFSKEVAAYWSIVTAVRMPQVNIQHWQVNIGYLYPSILAVIISVIASLYLFRSYITYPPINGNPKVLSNLAEKE